MATTLLPGASGAFETVMSQTNRTRLDRVQSYPAILSTLWNADTCPESELSLLAWALSVDIWDEAWSVSRKRRVVGESLAYHRAKTTPAGVRMALSYRDADLVSYNLPRHGLFVDRAVSRSDEQAWRARLPELRIHDGATFTLAGSVRRFVGRDCFVRGDARLARRAVMVRDGMETPLVIQPRDGFERITLPVARQAMTICGRGAMVRLAGPLTLPLDVLAVRPLTGSQTDVRSVVSRGDRQIVAHAARRQIDGATAIFKPVGRSGRQVVAPVTVANGYIAMRFSYSAGRTTAHKPLNIVGRSRLMRPAYTAAWTVDWSRPIAPSRFPTGRKVAGSSTAQAVRLMTAIQSAAALRDVNAIDFKATDRLTYADLHAIRPATRYGQRKRKS
ncbi:phage tail protein I [Rhizobium sp. CFBP 8762]|uniref:phage tail protein I n=1 Tax=Rhizobium sp. CFBP 8762 TaxID=2775279 RepID=UPI0018D697D6|nr:phage tail protein I [Rhizobium sp. CFBP 8762]